MTLTEHSPDLGPDNLPSFYRPAQRVTVGEMVRGLGRAAGAVVSVLRPVETLASHGDHFVLTPQPETDHFEDGTGPQGDAHPDVHPEYVEAEH